MKFKLFIFISLLLVFPLFSEKLTEEEQYEMTVKAMKYEEEGHYREALTLYLNLHESDPLNRALMNQIGYLYYKLGDLPRAKSYFYLTLKWYGDDVDARIWLGFLYYEEKNYQKAREFIEPIAICYPTDIKTNILYAKIQMALKDLEGARKTLEGCIKRDKEDIKAHELLGEVALLQGKYHEAFCEYKESWTLSKHENRYLDGMIGVRDLTRIAIKTYTSYTREREIDLVSGDYTNKMNVWYNNLELSLPFPDGFRFYVNSSYNPEQQFNVPEGLNNYNVNKYAAAAGMEYRYFDHVYLKLESDQKWGHGKGGAIFPFSSEFLWQPKMELGLAIPSVTYAAKGYKESFIARNFDSVTSYFAVKRGVMNEFTFRLFKDITQLGIKGSTNLITAQNTNRLRNFSFFFVQKINPLPIKARLSYSYLWGSYDNVNEDYFSYRARYRHKASFQIYKPWGERHLLSLRYSYKWQKLRDFTNIAEMITPVNPLPPQILPSNIMHANELEFTAQFSIQEHFTLEGACLYYHDTNHYQILNGRFSLNFYF